MPEQKIIIASTDSDTALTNIVNMYMRFSNDQVAVAAVTVTFEGEQLQTITKAK